MEYLKNFMDIPENEILVKQMHISNRHKKTEQRLKYVESEKYINELVGTIGADPLFRKKE